MCGRDAMPCRQVCVVSLKTDPLHQKGPNNTTTAGSRCTAFGGSKRAITLVVALLHTNSIGQITQYSNERYKKPAVD